MTTNISEMPKPVKLREKISRRLVLTAMKDFTGLPEAVRELVDNAFDEFDGHHGGGHLSVNIQIRKDRIAVENIGGKGMGADELQDWLEWGASHKVDAIGEYGQGGKGAMGYLGNAWCVKTKKWDESWVWEVRDDNWRDVTDREKEYEATPNPADAKYQGVGYCPIEVKNLEPRRQDIARLTRDLSNTYRQLLLDSRATITVNGTPVEPLELPLYDGFKTESVDCRTPSGMRIRG